jgi:NAD(P)-dependent dehydrogenase (short-subunit alcohol dehydrogenase family)
MQLPTLPSFRLDGRRALVTGASRGIGLAGASALAQAGAHVVCASRQSPELDDVVAAINGEGWSAEKLVLDVSDVYEIERAVAGRPAFDILFNNAGAARPKSMLDTTAEDFDAVMDVNLRGAYFVARAVAGQMIGEGKGGSIIHMSSQMGHVGGIDRTVYGASKHAIEGLSKSMAIEFGPHGIRVNCIAPTFIRTPLTETTFADPDRLAWIKSKLKIDRIGELEDVMGAIVFLAGDAARLITGASIRVDGGWTAG